MGLLPIILIVFQKELYNDILYFVTGNIEYINRLFSFIRKQKKKFKISFNWCYGYYFLVVQSALVAESFFSLIILSIFVFSVLGKKNYKFLNHPLMTKFDLKKLCNLSSILKFTFLYELLNGFIYKSCSVVSLTLKLGFLSAGGFNLLGWIYNVQKAC